MQRARFLCLAHTIAKRRYTPTDPRPLLNCIGERTVAFDDDDVGDDGSRRKSTSQQGYLGWQTQGTRAMKVTLASSVCNLYTAFSNWIAPTSTSCPAMAQCTRKRARSSPRKYSDSAVAGSNWEKLCRVLCLKEERLVLRWNDNNGVGRFSTQRTRFGASVDLAMCTSDPSNRYYVRHVACVVLSLIHKGFEASDLGTKRRTGQGSQEGLTVRVWLRAPCVGIAVVSNDLIWWKRT